MRIRTIVVFGLLGTVGLTVWYLVQDSLWAGFVFGALLGLWAWPVAKYLTGEKGP